MKTPEELAEEWIEINGWNTEPFRDEYTIEFKKQGYVAGYQAAAPQWISVKDRLPEERKHILWCHKPTQEIAVGYLLRADIKPYFTHWMPLPKPPEE